METIYRLIPSVDQNDLDFLIPAENDAYKNLNIRLYVREKLTGADGKALQETDQTGMTNDFLHLLFTQCSLSLNGTTITQTTALPLRLYLATLLKYCSVAAASLFTNAFWYIDNGTSYHVIRLRSCQRTRGS